MKKLCLKLLGMPEAWLDDRRLEFATRKAFALLIYLAVEAGSHSREKIAALFWAESDSEHARAALRRTLAYVRDAIGPDHLTADRNSLSLNPDSNYELDLKGLETASRDGTADSMIQAVSNVRGDFLEGFSIDDSLAFDDWVSLQREIHHQRMMQVFNRLSRLQAEEGQRAAAIETATQWARRDPLNESAHQRLMELHFANGDRPSALQAYETCKQILARELDLEPSPETQALAERIRAEGASLQDRKSAARRKTKPIVPFVGRQDEHTQLIRLFHEVRLYQTRIVLLQGEPGIGKTRLAQEFTAWARAQGADVLQSRAIEVGNRLPFQPIVEAFRSVDLGIVSPDLSPTWLSELIRLLPELQELFPDLPPPLMLNEEESKVRLFEAVVRFVQAMADRNPVLLFVDDLQWADSASLDLLNYAMRRWTAANLPVLILFTIRSEDLKTDAALAQRLSSLGRDRLLTSLELKPLSLDESKQLIASLGGSQSDQVAAKTGGHPLFIIETVRAGESIPTSIRDLIRSRLARLSPPSRTLCTAASVTGTEFEFEMLRRVADLNEQDGLSALDELIARGLLHEANGKYAFVHDQLREVTYAEAGEGRRRVLHRRALDVLASFPVAELVRHAVGANLPDNVFELSIAAGNDALRLFAVRDAIAHYERALTIRATSHLYQQLGRAYELIDEADKARKTYEALLQSAHDSKDSELECIALNRLATLASRDMSDLALAERLLQTARTVAEGMGSQSLLAETELNLAQLGIYRTDIEWMRTHGERALALARQLNSEELLARALNQIAFAETVWGQVGSAIPRAEEAHQLYAALGNRVMEADSLCLLSDAGVRFGKLEQGIASARLAQQISNEIENVWGQANSAIRLGLGLLESGEYEEALRVVQRGAELARRHNILPLLVLNLTVIGNIHRAVFMLEQACLEHEEALKIAVLLHYPYFEEMANSELCADRVLAGDIHKAAEYARQALALRNSTVLAFPGFSRWAEVEALCQTGNVDSAEKDVQCFGEFCEGNPRYRLVHLRSLAILAKAAGEMDQSRNKLREAIVISESIGLPGESWQLFIALGQRDPARAVISSLAGKMKDMTLRKSFTDGARKQIL
jgi:DNA-binding SARP family transcriptional activator/predicted ATPase